MTVLGRLAMTRGLVVFIVIMLATPVLVGLTAHAGYQRIQLPDVGLDVDADLGVESRDGRWVGVEQRDKIVDLDGVPVRSPADWVARSLAHDEATLRVTFRRGDRTFSVTAPVKPLELADQFAIWARLATGAALMIMGLIVFVARPGVALSWLMFGLAWVLGAFLLVKIFFWSDPRLAKVLSTYPWLVATSIGLHFMCFFPQRIEWFRAKPRRAALLYIPLLLGPVIHLYRLETRGSLIGTAWATIATLGLVAVIASQYRRVRQSKNARSRSQYRALLVGFAVGLALPAAWNWLRITLDIWNSPWAAYYNALPLVIFIGITSYAVVRLNALAIDRFTAAVVGYAITTIVLGGAFAAALVGIPLLLGSSGLGNSPALLVGTTALTFSLFAPVYRAIKRWVDRRFFREQAGASVIADALRDLVLKLQQSTPEEALEAAFTAGEILKGDRLELWLVADDARELRLDRHVGASAVIDTPISLEGPLGEALASGVSAGIQELAPRALETAAQEELWARELAMVAPIMANGVVAGCLAVGRKRSGAGYSIEDLSFLTIIGAQVGAVLERTRSDKQLDRYHLERRIGTGGMAEVYLAWQVGPGGFERKVALKRPLPHVSEDPNAVASFLDEARLAAQLVHPNIARVYDVGERAGSYYIVMEHVDGPSLRHVYRDMQLFKKVTPVPIAVTLMRDVLSALDYAHKARDEKQRELKLVHRDVSPRNILLTRQAQPKLVDFGIARAQFQLHVTRTGVVKGTLPYMSPEQAHDQEIDNRADIYSAGALFYELITGETAFPKGPVTKRPKAPSSIVPGIPAAIDTVIKRATDYVPRERFATAGEFADALVEAIKPEKPAESDQVIAFLRDLNPQMMGRAEASDAAPQPADETEEKDQLSGPRTAIEGDRTGGGAVADRTVVESRKRRAED